MSATATVTVYATVFPSATPSAVAIAASVAHSDGAALIGCWVMVTLYGVASAQSYSYLSEYKHDPLWLKGLVVLLWVIDTVHVIFTCHVTYFFLVISAFKPEMIMMNVWSTSASVACHVLITVVVFAYFIRLAVQLSGTRLHYTVTIALAIPALGYAIAGLGTVARMRPVKLLANIRAASEPWTTAMAVTQVAVDLLLSTVLCVLLHKKKSAFKRTNVMIRVLLLFAIGRGILTAIGETVILLAVTIDPSASWYNSAAHVVAGLYINSLLVTLNARNSIQKTSEYTDTGLLVVPVSHGNHARTANRQSVIQDAKPPQLDLERAKSSNLVENHADVITFSFEKTHDRDGGNSEAS